MKTIFKLLIVILVLSGCSRSHSASSSKDEVVEITEKMFIEQINDVYLNAESYLGKTIKLEGIFEKYYDEEYQENYYMVFRNGPGCCATDGVAGFEIAYDGADEVEDDDWVEAIGTLTEYEDSGMKYLRLDLSSLKVLEERGKEYVDSI